MIGLSLLFILGCAGAVSLALGLAGLGFWAWSAQKPTPPDTPG